ncbi:MAG: GAF domain-containing protein [Polyangiaceae bacterium]|nr:GAF domain-containing protein [Polyangiaceae bacterium]
MESTTSQRTAAEQAMSAKDDATIHLLDAAMQRAWATAEPLLLLVRAGKPEAERLAVEHLRSTAAETGAWAMSAEANIVGLDPPYGPLARALATHAPRIAIEPGSLGNSIRHRLSHSAAPMGRLLGHFCPDLAPFAPASSDPEPLTFGFAMDRLETLLARVFAALAPPERPLVFFLHDADRADAATLRILSRILAHTETRQLVVVALVDPGDKPRNDAAWKAFSAGRKYVVERFDIGVTQDASGDGEPTSGTHTTRLPAGTRRVLAAAACNGRTADAGAIATALEASSRDVTELLQPAIDAGIVARHGSSYAFVDARSARACRYAMDAQTLGRMHLLLGKSFAFETSRKSASDAGFVAAAHLGIALDAEAIEGCDDAERVQLAGVLVDAAERAMRMAAHEVADGYLDDAARVLVPSGDVWSSGCEDLAARIDFARLECACAMGDGARAKGVFEVLGHRVPSAPQMRAAERCLVELATRSGQHEEAMELAARALAPLGIHLEASPSREVADRAFEGVWGALGDRAIEEIADLERMTDRNALDATEMLFTVHPSAQAIGAGPADLVACHLSRLALVHGNADASSVGHAALGATVIGRKKDHRTGYRLGKVALDLCKRRGAYRHHAAVSMKFAAAMSIWTHPLQTSIEQCARTYEIALACGDARAGCRLAAMIAFLTLLGGTSLDEVSDEALRRRRAIRSQGCDDEGMGDLCDAIERFVGQQKGRPAQRKTNGSTRAGNMRLGHVACRVVDLVSLVVAQEYDAALAESVEIGPSIADVGVQILVPEYQFWSMLAATSIRSSGLPEGLDEAIEDFEGWADRCPQTFQHKHALLLAERCRLQGRDMDAMRAYDQAITEARESGFAHIEGLAAEMATRFHAARDFSLIASAYFRTARNAYGRWGASFKTMQLDRRHPKFSGTTDTSASTPPPSLRGSADIDVFTAVKTAQSVSKEIVLQRLLVTLMRIVIEHGGAERCHVLLEQEDGALNHVGKAFTTSKGVEIEVPGPTATALDDILPVAMIDYVQRSHELVCVDDAALDRAWAEDPYISVHRPRSVVCFPIMRQSTIVGMLYLENNSARGVFTPRRLALLEFLTNQASISLDHAKLYADLARENAERRRAEQVLRDKLKIIERQKDDIRALSTPLLDVSDGVVAMPILGELDEERASRVMDILLETITKRSVHSAILDLTGVSSIGNATAEQLGRIVRAVELVGARAIVAGIRADVARAIVSLDVGLGRIETRASMKDALRVLVKTAPAAVPSRSAAKNQSRPLR